MPLRYFKNIDINLTLIEFYCLTGHSQLLITSAVICSSLRISRYKIEGTDITWLAFYTWFWRIERGLKSKLVTTGHDTSLYITWAWAVSWENLIFAYAKKKWRRSAARSLHSWSVPLFWLYIRLNPTSS